MTAQRDSMSAVQEHSCQLPDQPRSQSLGPRRRVLLNPGVHPVFLVGYPGASPILLANDSTPRSPALSERRRSPRGPPPSPTYLVMDGTTRRLPAGCSTRPSQHRPAEPANPTPRAAGATNRKVVAGVRACLLGGRKVVENLLRLFQGWMG